MTAGPGRGGAAGPRRIWWVRHGETTGQSSIRFHGQNDVPLSDLGRAQVRALLPLLHGVDFAHVVHSPLSRAAESAALLATGCNVPRDRWHSDPRLAEISFGACEGLTEGEIEAAHPGFLAAYRRGEAAAFPGGEPRREFAARIAAAAHDWAARPWDGDLLVVAHRGVVRQGLRALLGMADGHRDDFGVALASLSVVRHEPPWQLEVLGLLP